MFNNAYICKYVIKFRLYFHNLVSELVPTMQINLLALRRPIHMPLAHNENVQGMITMGYAICHQTYLLFGIVWMGRFFFMLVLVLFIHFFVSISLSYTHSSRFVPCTALFNFANYECLAACVSVLI